MSNFGVIVEKSSNCELKTNNRIEWIVSGMTMNFSKIKESKFSELIIKLTKSYLIPYFYLNLISFPIWQLYITQSGSDVPIVETLFGVLYSNDLFIKMISGWTWFMTTLFLCHVILIFLIKIFDDNKQIFFASLLLGVIAYLDKENVRPWHFDAALCSVLFMFVGNIIKTKISEFDKLSKKQYVISCILLFIGGSISHILNHRISLHGNSYGNHFVLFYVTAICYSLFIILIIVKLPNIKLINFMGKNTLLYLTVPLYQINFFRLYFPELAESYLINLVLLVIITLDTIPVILIVNKFFPFIVNKKDKFNSDFYIFTSRFLVFSIIFFIPTFIFIENIYLNVVVALIIGGGIAFFNLGLRHESSAICKS